MQPQQQAPAAPPGSVVVLIIPPERLADFFGGWLCAAPTAEGPAALKLHDAAPADAAPSSAPLPMPLRDVEACALEAAPASGERPIPVAQLARRAGYRDSGHLREAVHQLVDRGLLVRIRGGVRRSNLPCTNLPGPTS